MPILQTWRIQLMLVVEPEMLIGSPGGLGHRTKCADAPRAA
jgi:hypothetical protein